MNRVFALVSVAAVFALSACSAIAGGPKVVEVGHSSNSLVGQSYQKVISDLEDSGFSNIATIEVDPRELHEVAGDGETKEVDIAGITSFAKDSEFLKDSQITVTYFALGEDDTTDAAQATQKTEEPTKSEPSASGSSTDDTDIQAADGGTPLTVENSPELAALLASAKDDFEAHKEFATAHAGQVIEFEGCLMLASPLKDGSLDRTFMINPGDCYSYHTNGPMFSMVDVTDSEFGLDEYDFEDGYEMGSTFVFVSEVLDYQHEEHLSVIGLAPISATFQF